MDKKYCIVCGKELKGVQTKYCSNKCKQKAHYEKSKSDNSNSEFSQTIRAIRRKLKLIDLKGGKCEKCGYDLNISALEFHHVDPTIKEFSLDSRNISNRSWDKILLEANKCKLLCSNCHKEVHYPDMTKEYFKNLELEKEPNACKKSEVEHHKNCPVCGSIMQKSDHRTYCSKDCREKAKLNKFLKYPSYEDINEKYKELNSWTKVADFYGLTRKIIIGIRNRNI